MNFEEKVKSFKSTTPMPKKLTTILPKNAKILDAGCGAGRTIIFLQKKGYKKVMGFDTNKKEIAFLKEGGYPVFESNVTTININERFDCIILMGVLSLLSAKRRKKAIYNLSGLLTKKGFFFIEEFKQTRSKRNIRRYKQWSKKIGEWGSFQLPDGTTVHHFNKEELAGLLPSFELAIIEKTFTTMNRHKAKGFQVIAKRQIT